MIYRTTRPRVPTPLELLADEAGLGGWELREYLRSEITRRQSGGNNGATQAPETPRNDVSEEPLIFAV